MKEKPFHWLFVRISFATLPVLRGHAKLFTVILIKNCEFEKCIPFGWSCFEFFVKDMVCGFTSFLMPFERLTWRKFHEEVIKSETYQKYRSI